VNVVEGNGHLTSSVVVGDLDVERVSIAPDEADAPLFIDADAVLARAVSPQRLHLPDPHTGALPRARKKSWLAEQIVWFAELIGLPPVPSGGQGR